eukprot:3941732-Rhodomonas_salina.5
MFQRRLPSVSASRIKGFGPSHQVFQPRPPNVSQKPRKRKRNLKKEHQRPGCGRSRRQLQHLGSSERSGHNVRSRAGPGTRCTAPSTPGSTPWA